MPMNAPVMETTGTDLVPTSYICGRTCLRFFHRAKVGPMLRKVRPTKIQKSPNAAMMLVVVRPTCSMKETAMAGNHKGHCRKLGGQRSCRYSGRRMGNHSNRSTDAAVDYQPAEMSRPLVGARSTLILLICINLFNYIDRQVLAAV